MSLSLKDPDATLEYSIDWAAGYLGNQTITASAWAIVPSEAGGLTVAAHAFDASTTRVSLSAGLAGHVYRVTNRVTLSNGESDDRSLTVRVEPR